MVTKKKNIQSAPLTLHRLLGELSYWGTTVRVGLVAFISLVVLTINALESSSSASFLVYGQMLVYIVGSFLVLDAGYVIIARALSLRRALDVATLCIIESLLALSVLSPYVALVSSNFVAINNFLIVWVLAILSLRLLVGALYGSSVKR